MLYVQADLLSREEEIQLFQRIKAGDETARERILCCNVRMVISCATRFKGATRLSIDDLIGEGFLGLMKAVQHFDERRGFKFSTYAIWWIKQAMIRSMQNKERIIRIPAHLIELLTKIRKKGVDPLREDMDEVLDLMKGVPKDRKILSNAVLIDAVLSLEAVSLVEDEIEEFSLLNYVTDSPVTKGERDSCFENLFGCSLAQELLDCLSPRERNIVSMNFGFDDGESKSLASIGRSLGISRERVRQIRDSAFEKMKKRAEEIEHDEQ